MKNKCLFQVDWKMKYLFQVEIKIPLAMRLLFFLIVFTTGFSFASNSGAQEAFVSLNLKNSSISEILHEIENQTDFRFYYNSKVVNVHNKLSIQSKKEKLSSILQKIFSDSNISYELKGRDIILTKKSDTSNSGTQNENKKTTITGFVSDEDGIPLIGVSVRIKGSGDGVISDTDGKYSITVTSKNTILEYSYIGYNPIEEIVGSRKIINVVLSEGVERLGEVVVVAYGTQKKESVVGAITTLNPSKLKIGTSRSLSNNLAGTVSGLIGVQRSGEPGYDDSSFWIRGISTFQGARSPLVLVDGIERSLNNIDVEEIESFSVLKDAAATAVYGVRGANGVILVNTKRGQIGAPSVNVKTEFAITAPVKLPDYIGAADYLQILDDIRLDNNLSPLYTEQIRKTRMNYDPDLYPDVNWIDEVTKDYASNTRTSIDISGGTERLRYSFVAALYTERGIIERDDRNEWDSSVKLQRYNVRTNVDMNLTRTTLMRFNIGGYLQERNAPSKSISDIFSFSFSTPPSLYPKQYSSGEIAKDEGENPWSLATQTGYARSSSSNIESLFSIEQDLKGLLPGLKIKGSFSFDRYSSSHVYRSKDPAYHSPATGRTDEGDLIISLRSLGDNFLGYSKGSDWGNKSTYFEGNLSYSQVFGAHAVDAMFLYSQRHYDNGDKLPYRNQGIAGRASYTYAGRYISEFNFGYNGSENFAKGNRFGFFPSVAIGWIVSEEPFMQPINNYISKLKLRGSYGLVGNDRLDGRRFAYLSTVEGVLGYAWGYTHNYYNIGGYAEGYFENPNFSWETVSKFNIGAEIGLLKGMIEAQIDIFKEKRKDIFMERQSIPSSGGFNKLPWDNFGRVDNKGIEVSLNVNKQFNKDFSMSFLGTFTYAKNKIIEKDEAYTKVGTYRAETGHPVGQWFGLIDEGLFTEEDFLDVSTGTLAAGIPIHTYGSVRPGDIKYKDMNADGRIDDMDKAAIGGTYDPQIVYGMGVNIRLKNVDLGVLFQGNAKTENMIGRDNGYFIPGAGNGAVGNVLTNANDRWTEENPSQDVFYPRLSLGFSPNNAQRSTWWLKDVSMLRMKNLEIGYSVPSKLLNALLLNQARIFFRGTNLLTFTGFDLWDPEVASSNGTQYPIMKSFSLGLNIRF